MQRISYRQTRRRRVQQGTRAADKETVPAGKEPAPTGKELLPPGKDSAPAQEKPPAKPPIPPPISSNDTLELIIPAPGLTIPSSFSSEIQPTARSGHPLALSEAVPARFFTHHRMPQATSSDSGTSRETTSGPPVAIP